MSTLTTESVDDFLVGLASAAPTPGGGSAAAVMGAMGASLVAMVCNLTVGKKGYEDAEAEMKRLLDTSETLREQLTGMVADDVTAFDALMGSYRLPKETDADKASRSAAIQAALRQATDVPLACARACAEVIRASARAAEFGNKNVISDAGVGVLAAWAALRSAALNVYINVPSIKDRSFADTRLTEIEALLAECGPLSEQVFATVKGKLG